MDKEMTPETMVALDAMEAGHPDAAKLLVGVPATVCIGSDRYAAKIVKCTPSLKTIVVADAQDQEWMTFRKTKRGYTAGSYRLWIGQAEDYRDPSF